MNKYSTFYFVLLVLFNSCATFQKPDWLDKRPYISNALEGVGFSSVKQDKKIARDTAYNDAIQKLVLTGEIQVQGYIETKLYAERGLPSNIINGKDLVDNVNKVIYDTVLKRKFFKEFYDDINKEYWVYVYIPESTLNRITAEQSLEMIKDKKVGLLKIEKEQYKQELDTQLDNVEKELEKDIQYYKKRESQE